jgi:hypothetical protein
MRPLRSLAIAAFAAAAVVGTASGASAIPAGARLTDVKPGSLHIMHGPGGNRLVGVLLRTSSCSRVTFLLSPATITPPIYGAYQIPTGSCIAVIHQWTPVSVRAAAPVVRVRARNGNWVVK